MKDLPLFRVIVSSSALQPDFNKAFENWKQHAPALTKDECFLIENMLISWFSSMNLCNIYDTSTCVEEEYHADFRTPFLK